MYSILDKDMIEGSIVAHLTCSRRGFAPTVCLSAIGLYHYRKWCLSGTWRRLIAPDDYINGYYKYFGHIRAYQGDGRYGKPSGGR